MKKEVPFVKVDRAHTVVQEGSVRLRLKTFWARLEPEELSDIEGVEVVHLRSMPSRQFTSIEEYDIIIQGDEDRRRIVQNAILQTLRGNTRGRNALVFLANRML